MLQIYFRFDFMSFFLKNRIIQSLYPIVPLIITIFFIFIY